VDSSARNVLDDEMSKHAWDSLRSFRGSSTTLPDAIRSLVRADSDDEADAAYWAIDNVTLVQGRLSQSSVAVAASLVAGLGVSTRLAKGYIIDLLAQISGGYDDHVDLASVGPVSWSDCMREIAEGFDVYLTMLDVEGNSSCVDLILMCATFDPALRARAVETFQHILSSGDFPDIQDLVAASLAELV
jgi:hypothetical protein